MVDKTIRTEIQTGVTGRESIVGFANDLDDVSKILDGELRTTATAAAAQLRELAKQDAAISSFNRLQLEARNASRALNAAEKETANYSAQIKQAGPPTAQEAALLQRLQAAADGARVTFAQQNETLNRAQAELQGYGVSAKSATDVQRRLRQEIDQVRDSVSSLVPSYTRAAASAQAAGTTMARAGNEAGNGVSAISNQLGALRTQLLSLLGINVGAQLLRDVAETADAYSNLRSRMQLVTGEGQALESSWSRVTSVALQTHSALEATATLYGKLTQAGLDAGLSSEKATAQALSLTTTINQAIQVSGASAQASEAAITQLVQGLQSGVLRGDEFNSVMEQSPRLARALADGMGVTTGELRKLAEAGQLTTGTVVTALKSQSAVIASEFGKLPLTIGRSLEDLSTKWTMFIGQVNSTTGVTRTVAEGIGWIAEHLEQLANVAARAGAVLTAALAVQCVNACRLAAAEMLATGGAATILTASLNKIPTKINIVVAATGFEVGYQIGGMLHENSELARKFGIALVGFNQALVNDLIFLKEAAAAVFTSDTVDAAFDRYIQRGKELDKVLDDMWKDAEKAPSQTAEATNNAANATQNMGVQAKSTIESMEKLQKIYGDAAAELESLVEREQKSAAVKSAEAAAMVALAQAYGTQKEQREAEAKAAEVQAAQLERLAIFRLSEVALLENELAALRAVGEEQIKNDPEKKKQLDKLEQEIGLRKLTANEALAQARASQINAEAAKAEVLAVEDNSGKVKELGEAYAQARRDLDLLRNMQAIGIKTQRDVELVENNLVKSARAYKDALKDQENQIRSRNTVEQAGFDLKSTAINLAIEQQRSILAVARASGDEWQAIQAENSIRRLQIELLLLTAKANEAEAKSSLALIEVKRAELIASGQLTDTKRLELDAATKAAQIKQLEAKIARETASGLERLGNARKASKGDIDGEADALKRLNGEREREIDNIVKRDNMGHETRTAGTSVGNRQGIIEWLKGAGLEDAVAEYISRDFVDAKGQVAYMGNGGQKKWNGSTITNALSNAVDYYKYGDGKAMAETLAIQAKAQKDVKEAKAKPTAAPTANTAPAPSSGGSGASGPTYVSHITLKGQTKTVKFADASSQAATEQLLQDLTNGKGVF